MKKFFRTRFGKLLLAIACAAAVFFLFYFTLGLLRGSSYFPAKTDEALTLDFRDQMHVTMQSILLENRTDLLKNQSRLIRAEGNLQFDCEKPAYFDDRAGLVLSPRLTSRDYVYGGNDVLMLFWISTVRNDVTFQTYLGSTVEYQYYREKANGLQTPMIVRAQLLPGLPRADYYRDRTEMHALPGAGLDRIRLLLPAAILLALLTLLLYYLLACVSARRPDTDALIPGPLNRLPFEFLLFGAAAVLLGGFCLERVLFYPEPTTLLGISYSWAGEQGLIALMALLLTGLFMSAAARIKQKNFLQNTLLYRFFRLLGRPFLFLFRKLRDACRKLPVLWKATLVILAALILDFILTVGFVNRSASLPGLKILLLLYNLLLIGGALALVSQFKELKKAGEKLTAGELDYQVPVKGMVFDLKCLGNDLNRIGGSVSRAVEERLKSERMKTELITNVSHDIRTPLTAIISYTELLKGEEGLSEQGREAVDVLSRQSERLNRLIGDLVEASKASSGTLDVELSPCSAAVFVTQAAGEYEERLKKDGLTLLTKVPAEPLRILADGRRMQRIFDNLLNNIRKYSLPGTRAYLDLEKKGSRAVFSFKNTSRDPLNISVDELMERFVRGDSSRHTEGNGLGLSIARSLAELQGGTLQIQIDGDLFKAVLSFPALD